MKSAASGWKRRMTRRGYVRCGSDSGTVRRRRQFCAQPAGTLQRWQSCWRIRRIPRRGSLRFCRRWGRRTCAMSGPPFCARRWTRAAAFRRRMNFPCNIFSARASGQNRCPAGEGRWRTASRRRGSGRFCQQPEQIWRGWGNIRQAPEAEYRQIVTLPVGAMRLRCADLRSQRLLFVMLCRTLGIPARLNPHSGAAEYFSGRRFLSPEEGQTISAALCLQKRPGETWQAGADFGLSVRTSDGWMPLDLSELSWQWGNV